MGILSSLLGIGQSAPTPVAPQTITTTELSKEIAPFMKDLLAKGQALYKTRTEEGYQPYTGQTLAELTPQQIQAREGLTGLVGSQAPQFAKAQELAEGVSQQMTPEVLQQYMSPYQQAVTDLDKAEAQKTFERDVLPKIRQAQIGAGAFGGTRGTMLEAQSMADQQKFLGDIQTRGSQAGYQDAVKAFEAQKAREGQTGVALAQLAPASFKAQSGELGLLEQIGKEDQQRSQIALDEAYKQYLQERVFPEQTLGQYQSVIAGFPSASTTRTTTTAPQPQQSGLGSLLSGALNVGNIYGTFGGFSPGGFGSSYIPQPRKHGGPIINRAFSGQIGTGGLVGTTPDGLNIWQRTQEGITNRSIHGGILEGDSTSQETLDAMSQVTPSDSMSTLPQTATGALADLPSVQQRQGIYNASEFRDAGMSLDRPSDAPETILGYQAPQSTLRIPTRFDHLGNPITGSEKIPQGAFVPKTIQTFGQGHDLEDMDYFTANALALNEGADRFMYGNEYAQVDPGLLSNYDYSNLGTKPYSDEAFSMRRSPEVAHIGGFQGQGMPTQSNLNQQIHRAKGHKMSHSGMWTDAQGQPVPQHNPLQSNNAQGGLVGLPVVRRQAGQTVFKLPDSPSLGLPEGMDLKTLQNLPVAVQQQILTGGLYNIYQDQLDRANERKTMEEQAIITEQERVDSDREARKSAAIGDMMGSMASGMKAGAGKGFWGEIGSGLEQAAGKSTEISKEDRLAIDTAEKTLAKNKKDAAIEWDKGNRDRALELLTIANQNYKLELDRLEVGYNKLNARNEAITQLSTLYRTANDSVFNEMAKNYIQNGLFQDMAEVNKIIKGESELPEVPLENNDNSKLTNTEIEKPNTITLEPLPEIEMTVPLG
jgi:hypothetical protein